MATSEIELAAKSIDLVATVLNSAGTIGRAGAELLKWLGREQLNENAFVYTMGHAQDFASPNETGLKILASLSTRASHLYGHELYGLQFVVPGALGRNILYDPRLRWVASTQAVISKYHPGMDECTFMMRALILSSPQDGKDPNKPIKETRMLPVVRRVVSSIALHTTNPKSDWDDLPKSLRNYPRHLMTPEGLARTIASIQQHCLEDLVVHVKYCVTDVLAWIVNHWHGQITVSAANSIVFQEQLGSGSQRLVFVIDEVCASTIRCDGEDHAGNITVSALHQIDKDHNTKPVQVFHEYITDPVASRSKSGHRHELYDIYNFANHGNMTLNKTETMKAEMTAQTIVHSVMDTQVSIHFKAPFTIRLEVDYESESSLKDWVFRRPGLMQRNLGRNTDGIARRLYTAREPQKLENIEEIEDEEDESMVGDENASDEIDLQAFCALYPELADLMTFAEDRCTCGYCSKTKRFHASPAKHQRVFQAPLSLVDNCLQCVIFQECLLLIGHALVDAAGATDVSNLHGHNSARSMIDATMVVMENIAMRAFVSWRHWFKLAASAVTGIPYDIVDEVNSADISSELIRWTAGSMSVVPRWLDLETRITLKHSRGISILNGAIAGLEADIAVIESQQQLMRVTSHCPYSNK